MHLWFSFSSQIRSVDASIVIPSGEVKNEIGGDGLFFFFFQYFQDGKEKEKKKKRECALRQVSNF